MAQNSENVLPTLRDFFNSEKPMSSGRTCRNNVSWEEDGFLFHQVLNSSRKAIPQRPAKLGNKSKDKHGFFYQNSKERSRRNISDAEKFSVEQYSSGGFFGVRLNTNGKQQRSAKPLGSERNMEPKLQKSFSARMQMSFMPSLIGSNQSSTNNPSSTSWFSRIKKMANPFSNRNSRRDPLIPPPSGCNNVSSGEMLSRNKSFRISSPVYLHAHLSIDYELGMPVFTFSLDRPDDVYIANTWMDDNDSQFVYSFHYIGGRSNRNVGDQRLKISGVESSLIGQMQVSTQICLEPEPDEDLVESEFVLFDIARARRSSLKNEKFSRQNSFKQGSTSDQSSYSENKVSDGLNEANLWQDKLPRQNSFGRKLIRSLSKHSETSASDSSGASNPWPASDLHPGLEIAAIVIQDGESLGYMKKNSELCKRVMKVIVPTGNHGLPDTDNSCPTPILQRWRSNGGCDCSGWDMGCHLFVLESREINTNHHILELFIEGGKEEKRAAMVMSFVREGQYEVEFHAKLSALQAFSICVAELHRSEVSRGERSSPLSSGCSSLRELIGMEAPMNRDGRTTVRDVLPSFMPNVTFSPISRV